jgi:hypothetical protein
MQLIQHPRYRLKRKARARDIESVYKALWDNVARINHSLDHLAHKPEPTLKERTTQLANELFALLNQQGSQPPHALSNRTGSPDEQRKTFDAHFKWQNDSYYKYMAWPTTTILSLCNRVRRCATRSSASWIMPSTDMVGPTFSGSLAEYVLPAPR